MATQVNTRFVIKLGVGLVVVCGAVVASFVFFILNTGADLARMGDKQFAAGHYKEAGDLYSKAVNKEQTNVAFLHKWVDALRKQTPDTQTKYMTAYRNLGGAMRQIAIADHKDLATQCEYLESEHRAMESSAFRRDGYDSLIREADTLIGQHAADPAGGPSDKLKRFRGMARLKVAIEAPDAGPEYLDGAKTDLEAALALDPADREAAISLERYYMVRAARAEAASQKEEVDGLIAKAGDVVSAFRAKNPGDAYFMLLSIQRELGALSREVSKRTDKPDMKALSDQFRAQSKPKLDEAAAAAMATPTDKVDPSLVFMLRQVEANVDPAAKLSRTEGLIRAALAARAQDVDMIAALADVLESREDHAAAVTQLQQLVDLPQPPVCLDGALLYERKIDAMFRQGLYTVRNWQSLQPGQDRERAVARAREVRDNLAKVQEASSPPVMLLDAELAYIDGDDRKADKLLDQFDKASHSMNPDALLIGAQVAIRLNEPGLAKSRLTDLLRVQPNNIRAAFVLGGLEAQLQNYERAEQLFQAIVDAIPGNQQALDQLKLVQSIRQGGKNVKVDDPATRAIIEADALTNETSTDPEGTSKAIALLTERITTLGDDPKLVRALAQLYFKNNNKDAASEVVRKGLVAHPDSRELKAYLIVLTGTDELETRLALIDAQGWTEEHRLSERYTIYRQFNKPDLAKAELEKAYQVAPNHPTILELVFMDAVENKDFEKAAKLTERAQKEDLDHAGGATYVARLESAKGNIKEAVRIMEDLVKAGGAQPESWRLLGRMQNIAGRSSDAVKSFKAALELRPNDVATIKDLLNTQVVMRQNEEALTTARKYKNFAQGDDEFMSVWLSLEAGFGNRDLVIQRREQMYKSNPLYRENLLALAALYMDSNRRAEARPLIDAARSKADGLDAVNLDAGWYWADGQKDHAKSIFETYIASIQKPADRLEPSLLYSQFLFQRQDNANGVLALEHAREYQSPTAAQVDKSMADTYLALGREDDAIAARKRIIDAKADTPEGIYRKRMIEIMIGSKKFAQADAELAPLLSAGNPDAVVLLLAAASRGAQNDAREQRKLLDRAVQLFPNDPMVFVKRGQSMLPEPGSLAKLKESNSVAYQEKARQVDDAVRDFSQALQLAPEMWIALRLRAGAYEELGDVDKAVADLRSALLANPSDDQLLGVLVAFLIKNGQDVNASIVAREILAKRPGDALARLRLVDVFGAAGKWDAASQFASMAFELDQQDAIAQRYLNCLLATTPPNLAEANNVLTNVLKPARVSINPGFLMAQAKVQMKQGKTSLASRTAVDALRLIKPDNTREMIAWYNDVQQLDPDKKQLTSFVESLMGAGVATDWLTYFRATLCMGEEVQQERGLTMLKDLLGTSKNTALRQLVYRSLGAALYAIRRYSDAEPLMRASLQEFPDDVECLNNLAYMLAKDLKKPAEGVTFAEAAAKLKPDNAEVLDTLGMVQLLNNKVDDSVVTLTKARSRAQSAVSGATVGMHLADALWTQGKKEQARAALDDASKLAEDAGNALSPQTKDELAELRKKITPP